MGILSRFFAKKEETSEVMAMESIKESMTAKIKKDYDAIAQNMKDEREQMLMAADSMQNYVNVLDQAKYPERTYPIIISKSIVSRKNFVTRMGLLVRQIRIPFDEKMDSTLEFYSELGKTIDSINAETIKDYAFLKMLFEKEGKDVVDTFRQISDINSRIWKMLDGVRNSGELMKKVDEMFDEIQSINGEIERDDLGRMSAEITDRQSELERIEKELGELMSGDEWMGVTGQQEEAEKKKELMSEKRREFEKIIDGIEAPLRKYNRNAHSKMLEDYISKSFDTVLCEDPKGVRILFLLKDVKTMVTQGKMEIKDREDVIKKIDEMNDNNTIGKVMHDYLIACEEAKKMTENVLSSIIVKKKLWLDSEIIRLKKYIGDTNSNSKKMEDVVRNLRERREKKVAHLEEMLHGVFKKRIKVESEPKRL